MIKFTKVMLRCHCKAMAVLGSLAPARGWDSSRLEILLSVPWIRLARVCCCPLPGSLLHHQTVPSPQTLSQHGTKEPTQRQEPEPVVTLVLP